MEQAIDVLSSVLNDESSSVRYRAVDSLSKFRRLANRALPLLAESWRNDTEDIRTKAARSFAEICACILEQPNPDIVRAFRNRLDTSNQSEIWSVANSLVEYGPQASFGLESLIHILTTRRDLDREHIQEISAALRNITGLAHEEPQDWEQWWRKEGHTLSPGQLPDPFDMSQVDDSGIKEGRCQFRTAKNPKGETRTAPLRTVFCPACSFPILPRDVFCHGCHEIWICEQCRFPLEGDKEVCENCGMRQPTALEYFGRFVLNIIGIVIIIIIAAFLMKGC